MSTPAHIAQNHLAAFKLELELELVWAIDLGGSSFTAELVNVTTGQVLKTIKSKKLAESLKLVDDFITKKWTFADYSANPDCWSGVASMITRLIAEATNGHEGIPNGLPLFIRQTGKIRALSFGKNETQMPVHDQWTLCFMKALAEAGLTNVNYALLPNSVEAKFTVETFLKNIDFIEKYGINLFLEIGSSSTQAGTFARYVFDSFFGATVRKYGLGYRTFEELKTAFTKMLMNLGLRKGKCGGNVFIMGSFPYEVLNLILTITNEDTRDRWLKEFSVGEVMHLADLVDASACMPDGYEKNLLSAVFTTLHEFGFKGVVFDPKGPDAKKLKDLTEKGWMMGLLMETYHQTGGAPKLPEAEGGASNLPEPTDGE